MTFMECLLKVLTVIGWILWFMVSAVTLIWGLDNAINLWNPDGIHYISAAFGVISSILFITTLIYVLQ